MSNFLYNDMSGDIFIEKAHKQIMKAYKKWCKKNNKKGGIVSFFEFFKISQK